MLYLCESAGARIIAWGTGISQIGTDYQIDILTWEDIPLGEVGDNLFRSIDVSFKHVGAFVVGITPIVDGVNLTEQQFSASGSGITTCQAFVTERGARIAARIRTLSRSGTLEFENARHGFVPIREFP